MRSRNRISDFRVPYGPLPPRGRSTFRQAVRFDLEIPQIGRTVLEWLSAAPRCWDGWVLDVNHG